MPETAERAGQRPINKPAQGKRGTSAALACVRPLAYLLRRVILAIGVEGLRIALRFSSLRKATLTLRSRSAFWTFPVRRARKEFQSSQSHLLTSAGNSIRLPPFPLTVYELQGFCSLSSIGILHL